MWLQFLLWLSLLRYNGSVLSGWMEILASSPSSFPCSTWDETPVLTVDTTHTVTEALSTSLRSLLSAFWWAIPVRLHSSSSVNADGHGAPHVGFKGLQEWCVRRMRWIPSPTASILYRLCSLANRNWRTLCRFQKANRGQCLRKGKTEEPPSPPHLHFCDVHVNFSVSG